VVQAPDFATALVSHRRRGRPPREEAATRRQARVDELARAAAIVLAQQGVRGTTMDTLAVALGIPKQVLYRHFSSKDELIHTILQRMSALWRELQSRPWKGLGRNLREVISLARANPNELKILVRHCASDPELRHYFDALHSGIVKKTDDLLAETNPRLAQDTMLRGLCAHAVAGFLIDGVFWWIEHGEAERDESFLAWAKQSLASLYDRWMIIA
jgi:AcrR family transcriptional regulator